MSLMSKIFVPFLDQFTVVFIADMLVCSKSGEEHKQNLWTSLQFFRDNQLYVKLNKCEFWLEQVVFSGHIISKDDLSVDSAKIEVVVNCKRPKNVSNVRSFLGLTGYYK